jgi:ferredoxin
MIVGHLKPMDEIVSSIQGFRKVLVLGCGTCVTVCLTGGDREARALVRELEEGPFFAKNSPSLDVDTVERQCVGDMLRSFVTPPPDTEAILSLACGAGVQTLAEVYPDLHVIPALNTTFLGALNEPGTWEEKCQGCGDCVLALTGGVCPVSRCAKRLLNGPCGGSSGGKCEINAHVDCAWQLIIDRLKLLGRLSEYEKIQPLKDWSQDRAGGPRNLKRVANTALV